MKHSDPDLDAIERDVTEYGVPGGATPKQVVDLVAELRRLRTAVRETREECFCEPDNSTSGPSCTRCQRLLRALAIKHQFAPMPKQPKACGHCGEPVNVPAHQL